MTFHFFEDTESLSAQVARAESSFRRLGKTKHARPRIVILGAGFGGLSAARALRHCRADITIVDRRNYHLFQPLLYQVATAGLSPSDIAGPIRRILRHQANARTVLGTVKDIDTNTRTVILEDMRLPYDYLVVATGARHAYSDDKWEQFAPGLKKIEDATWIRGRILMAFERAETCDDAERKRRLLTFIIVGGGPTGVEMAGAIAELAKRALKKDFRNIEPGAARIILLQRGPRVLPGFAQGLSRAATKALSRLGVEVHTGVDVEGVDEKGASAAGQRFDAHTVIWAAGVMASPAGRWLDTARDRQGRIEVNKDLSVANLGNVFAIGDTASVTGADGHQLPGIAPVAKRQGIYAARVIRARIAGTKEPAPFLYRHISRMATVGRSSAVVDLGFLRLTGCTGWLVWSVAHVFFLIGFRNKFAVSLNWLWAYFTYESGMRLITGLTK